MKSFENGLLLRTPISHAFLMVMRKLGEHRGRQVLFTRQYPEVLETLRRAALMQGTESSCRMDGIEIPADRMTDLVAGKAEPRDLPEREVAGYRDALAEIQAESGTLWLSVDLVRRWQATICPGAATSAAPGAVTSAAPGAATSAAPGAAFLERTIELFQQSLIEGMADPLLLIAGFLLDFDCIRPFGCGHGRLARLLAVFLLLQNGYDAVRYVGLERIVEGGGEACSEALRKSALGWREGAHDLRPWWEYFALMLSAAYGDFESRVGRITSARGAKREMVRRAVEGLPRSFAIEDLRRACPGVSAQTFQRALDDLKKEGKLRALGRGPDARWKRMEE